MNRALAFGSRNFKELTRDPLSYIFCLGFPVIMLAIMSIVNASIPEEAGMTLFRIDKLSPGIAVFGQTFVMLFAALIVSKDRSGSFLVRMYSTPMRPADFTVGYILPLMLISVLQLIVTDICSVITALITGAELSIAGLAVSFIVLIPSALMFVSFGLLFGTLFSDKAAPGLCSIIISLGSFLGCIWFDAEQTGGIMYDICRCFPFFYCTKSARSAVALDLGTDTFVIPIIVVAACAAVLTLLSSAVFGAKMKADLS